MSTKKPDISQIKKYLQNELDARAMHQLEREAQDDPFLAEAMEGFESAAPEQEANFADLQARLAQRTEPEKERNIWLWRVLPLAACLLIALLAGYWYFSPKQAKQQYADVVKPKPIVERLRPADSVKPAAEPAIAAPRPKLIAKGPERNPAPDTAKATTNTTNFTNGLTGKVAGLSVSYKADTVAYQASNYTVRNNAKVEDVLKKVPGVDVDSAGNVTYQGQAVTKARLNGKDYAGGDVQKAIQSLPVDIVEKIQVIDDYGDQASKTGIKDGSPTKVLELTIADSTKKKQIAVNNKAVVRNNELREVAIIPQQQVAKKESVISQAAIPHVVTGNVSNNKGEPLVGAVVKWTDNPRIYAGTNIYGNFKITVPAQNGSLLITYIGFQSREVNIGVQDSIKITLTPEPNSLSEVVVMSTAAKKMPAIVGSADTIAQGLARPAIGWDDYNRFYLDRATTMADGATGEFTLGITIAADNTFGKIRVISSTNPALNEKAIAMIKNGPRWVRGTDKKEVVLKIVFHK